MPLPEVPEVPEQPAVDSPLPVYSGPWGKAQAERLLWRAAFGPAPGWTDTFVNAGLEAAVHTLTRPAGENELAGPEPTSDGDPIEPEDAYGHDHLWFMDRMVRASHQLVERMTLVWHDWFATSDAGVGDQGRMIAQNELFRAHALGSFAGLLREVTIDEAMLLWLNGIENRRNAINENYAREVMELFTLGADRGAYTEIDVRELAKALSGWRADWVDGVGWANFRFDPNRHAATVKTLFAEVAGYGPKTGNFGWEQALQLCLDHPLHPSFLVEKLWSYFIPTPPPQEDREKLEAEYLANGRQVGPLVEAILLHPDFYEGPRMVKPPVVLAAGLLRAQGRYVDDGSWWWLCQGAGQFLFHPPDVSGWDDSRWLDTGTMRGRWYLVTETLYDNHIAWPAIGEYDATETPQAAVAAAMEFWGNPSLPAEALSSLTSWAQSCLPGTMAPWQQRAYRGYRQNALRQLIASSPDFQTS